MSVPQGSGRSVRIFCERCAGLGWDIDVGRWLPGDWQPWPFAGERWVRITCPLCRGAGRARDIGGMG